SGDVQRQVEPVDAEPDQVAPATPRLAAVPLLAVGRALEPRLVGDEVGLHRVDLAEFAVAHESAGLLDRCVRSVGQGEHEMTVLLLRLADQPGEVGGPNAGWLLAEDVTAGLQ